MPSVNIAPARFAIDWGVANALPARVSVAPMNLVVTMGWAKSGPGTNLSPVEAVPKLDRITRQEPVTNGNIAHERFQVIWQRTMEAIEKAFANQQGQIEDLTAIITRLEAAEAQAQEAQATAQATVQADALAKSYVEPQGILTAQADGTIFIDNHTRYYGNGASVSVTGGAIGGYSIGDYVQVYYDDAARVGGSVLYQGTTGVVVQQDGRHIVGGVGIPPPEASPITGNVQPPPGYVPKSTRELDSQ